MADPATTTAPFEMATVLFTDIVGFSLNPLETQTRLLGTLQTVVRGTAQFQKATAAGNLISLPTGDGMALAFFGDPVAAVQCAIEIQNALRSHPEVPLRTGVNMGPIMRHSDIKDRSNVIGGGINMAQRVMDVGDAGHILVSRSIAEVLEQLEGWPASLHDLGTCQVKHGVVLHLYSVHRDGAGNPETPGKLKAQRHRPGKWPISIGAGIAALAAILLAYFFTDWFRPAPPKRALQYYLLLKNAPTGQPVRLGAERVFEAGHQVRLVVSSPEAGYLYVVNEGPKSTAFQPDLNALFPSPLIRDGSAFISPGQVLNLPPDNFFVFDKEKGTERLWVIWSQVSIPELDGLKKWVNAKDRGAIGDVGEARATLDLINRYAAKVDVQTDEANKITTLAGTGNVLVHAIPLDHD